MTTQDLINWFGINHFYVLGYFAVILVIAIISVLIVNQNNIKNVKYVMSALVYGVTIPGVLAVLLTLYNLLIIGASLLNVNIVAYFLPIAAMIITLLILNRKVKMTQLPGFSRLSSLIIMISIAFLVIFVLQRTYFGVLIFGGFTQVILVFAVLLVILKVSWAKFTK